MALKFQTTFLLLPLLVILSAMTIGCTEKERVAHETQKANLTAQELKAQLKKLETEVLGIGPLGRYHYAQKSHLNELRGQIEVLKKELSGLKEEREEAKAKAASVQKEVEVYWAKY